MQNVDIVIIGAGIAGAGLAAHLPADKKVLILEAEAQAGYHSTGRSAAFFIGNYGNATIRALNALSLPRFQTPGIYGIEQPLLSLRGEVILAQAAQTERFEALLAEESGFKEIPLDDAYQRIPLLREGLFARAALESAAYDIDVDLLHQAWLKTASNLGHRLMCNHRIMELKPLADGWEITTSTARFYSPIIVNAAGAWADSVAELASVPCLGLVPKRRSIAVISPPDNIDVKDWPMVVDIDESWYVLPRAGKLLVSPADAEPVPAGDAYVDDLVLAQGVDRFESAMNIQVERVEHSWAGLRTFAPDNTPVMGFDEHRPGFFWLAGQGGYGVQTAPAMSEIAAALVLGHETEHPGLEVALSPKRFK